MFSKLCCIERDILTKKYWPWMETWRSN